MDHIKDEEQNQLLQIFKFIDCCSIDSAALILRELMACHRIRVENDLPGLISTHNGRITVTLQ